MKLFIKRLGARSALLSMAAIAFVPMGVVLVPTVAQAQTTSPPDLSCYARHIYFNIYTLDANGNRIQGKLVRADASMNTPYCTYIAAPGDFLPYKNAIVSVWNWDDSTSVAGNFWIVGAIPFQPAACLHMTDYHRGELFAYKNGKCSWPQPKITQIPTGTGLYTPRRGDIETGPIPTTPTKLGQQTGENPTPIPGPLPKIILPPPPPPPPPPAACANVTIYYGPWPATYGPYDTLASTTGCNFAFTNVRSNVYGAMAMLKPPTGPAIYTQISKFTVGADKVMKGEVTNHPTTGIWMIKQKP